MFMNHQRLSSSTNDVYIINNYLKAVTTRVSSPFVGRGNILFAVFFHNPLDCALVNCMETAE